MSAAGGAKTRNVKPKTFYMTHQQWKTGAEALPDPEDSLIVEGDAAYDPTREGRAVYSIQVTTKKHQAAQRQAATPVSQ